MSAVPRDGSVEQRAADGGALPLALEGLAYEAGGRRLIDGVSAVFEPGPVSVVLGPNGAGKSLLLRLAHGLIRPSAGRVVWRGPRAGDAARRQAMVFQRPVLLRRSTAANVAYALALAGVPRAERVGRVAAALERAGLGAKARQAARTLSGGEQQRLALARAWALAPEVLFLDEPTASLDPAGTAAVEALARDFAAAGTKVVMTTHDLAQARRLADEVLFLHRGRLVERAAAAAFFEAPRSEAAAAFVAGRLPL